jgi:agmatinase
MEMYRCSEHLAVERAGRDGVVIRDTSSGRRLRLGHPLYRFIRTFERPRGLEEGAPAEACRFVREMIGLGFLVPAERPPREAPTSPGAARLFAAPPYDPDAPADFTFLGIPYDGGSTAGGGARRGPEAIRAASRDLPYVLDRETCRPRGWFDEDAGTWILRGTTLSDRGNVVVRPGDDPARISDRATAAAAELIAGGTVPIVLGGDHSITYAVLRAFTGRPLAIVHFDAHTDCSPYEAGREHHHGNVFSRVLTLPAIAALVQVGVRGFLSREAQAIGDARRVGLTPSVLRRIGMEGVLAHVPPEVDVYVSLDVDVVDPASAPGTATPRMNGLSVLEVRDLLVRIGEERRVVGGDLVEVNPDHDVNGMTALLAVDLILAFLGAIARRREAGRA